MVLLHMEKLSENQAVTSMARGEMGAESLSDVNGGHRSMAKAPPKSNAESP